MSRFQSKGGRLTAIQSSHPDESVSPRLSFPWNLSRYNAALDRHSWTTDRDERKKVAVHPEVVGGTCYPGPESAHLGRSGFVLRVDAEPSYASFGPAAAAAWKAALRTDNFEMHGEGG